MEKVRTLFFGTSDFAVEILKELLEQEYLQVNGIVTQPDKPVGRKQTLTPPTVKRFILDKSLSIPVEQPAKIKKSSNDILSKYRPELIIVASYGQIIPKSILEYPKYKCLNVHVSLLPKLRGAVPMPMAILHGFKSTGVTLQVMSEKMDEGDIIAQKEFKIEEKETTETLTNKSAQYARVLIKKVLHSWVKGNVQATSQNHGEATYCYIKDLSKEKAEIKYSTDVDFAERMVRAFYPWPIAWFVIQNGVHKGKRLKIFKANIENSIVVNKANMLNIHKINKNLYLELHNGFLKLEEIQLEGKSRGLVRDYLYLA